MSPPRQGATDGRRQGAVAFAAGVIFVGLFLGQRMDESSVSRSAWNASISLSPLMDTVAGFQDTMTSTVSAWLPAAFAGPIPDTEMPVPNLVLVDGMASALRQFDAAYPVAAQFPGYDPARGGASRDAALANLEAACNDFPDLPAIFGAGAHKRACYEWTAFYLGVYHAALARVPGSGTDAGIHHAWLGEYYDLVLDVVAEFTYAPEDSPSGLSYRDTPASGYQNTLRAGDVVILGELLRQAGGLTPARRDRGLELATALARAWYAQFWLTGIQPSTGMTFTALTEAESPSYSLAGRQVTPRQRYVAHWDADKGNTPAEEVAWMGAGVMLAVRAAGGRLADAEPLAAAGRHYVEYALAMDRPDRLHGGRLIRTLNAETSGGIYGQRRYWLENHTPDLPSLPYVAATWYFIGTALMASPEGDQVAWPGLVPDAAQWTTLISSWEESLRAADGTFLVDLRKGHGIGYNMSLFPRWTMPCGRFVTGRQYPHFDKGGGPDLYLGETGYPAGLDLVVGGWPVMRLAAARGDVATYKLWQNRISTILEEYIARPPQPNWTTCGVAPYLSKRLPYHWSRMAASLAMAYLGAGGFSVEPW